MSKNEFGVEQWQAPRRRIFLQQISMIRKNKQMAPSPRQLLNRQGCKEFSDLNLNVMGYDLVH